MKYLSSKPFTGGANSKAFVDRWDETFGTKSISPRAEDSPGSEVGNPLESEVEQLKSRNAKLLDALYMLRWDVRDRAPWLVLTHRERDVLNSAAMLLAECGRSSHPLDPSSIHEYMCLNKDGSPCILPPGHSCKHYTQESLILAMEELFNLARMLDRRDR